MVIVAIVPVMASVSEVNYNLSFRRRDKPSKRNYCDHSDHPASKTGHAVGLPTGIFNCPDYTVRRRMDTSRCQARLYRALVHHTGLVDRPVDKRSLTVDEVAGDRAKVTAV